MHPHMWDLNNDGFLFLLPCYCDECVFFTCIFPHLLIPAPEHGSSSRTHTLTTSYSMSGFYFFPIHNNCMLLMFDR